LVKGVLFQSSQKIFLTKYYPFDNNLSNVCLSKNFDGGKGLTNLNSKVSKSEGDKDMPLV
jgi:hypothetical protein